MNKIFTLMMLIALFAESFVYNSASVQIINDCLRRIPSEIKHVKFDIGLSYSAPQAQSWLEKEPNDLLVFGFEPNPEAIESISSGDIKKRDPNHGEPLNKKYIDSNRFFLMPFALSNVEKEENLDFYITEIDCGTSSLYRPIGAEIGPVKKIVKVPVISLKAFFDIFPWDKFEYIDYIKIDAQGADLNILKSAGLYLSERVVYVTAEPDGNQYDGASSCGLENIKAYMHDQGFLYIEKHPNTSDPTFLNKKYLHLRDKIFIFQN